MNERVCVVRFSDDTVEQFTGPRDAFELTIAGVANWKMKQLASITFYDWPKEIGTIIFSNEK